MKWKIIHKIVRRSAGGGGGVEFRQCSGGTTIILLFEMLFRNCISLEKYVHPQPATSKTLRPWSREPAGGSNLGESLKRLLGGGESVGREGGEGGKLRQL